VGSKETRTDASSSKKFSFGKRPLPRLDSIFLDLRQQRRIADLLQFRGLEPVAAGPVQGAVRKLIPLSSTGMRTSQTMKFSTGHHWVRVK